MVSFFSNILQTTLYRSQSLFFAIAEVAVIFRALLSPAFQVYYKSTVLSDALQERVDAIYKKYKDRDTATKKVTKLLVDVKYPSLGMVTYALVMGTVAVLFTLPLMNGGTRLDLHDIAPGLGPMIPSMCDTPFDLLRGSGRFITKIGAILMPVAAGTVTWLHDRYFAGHSVVERKNFDSFVLTTVIMASSFLPMGFAEIWILSEVVGLIQIAYVKKTA